jgi:hypothetical protein
LVEAVPVVNTVVPAGTVSAVAVPVAVVADDAATAVVETVAPPLVEAVPVLEPVVQPVSDLVTGASTLPVTLPNVPDAGVIPPGSAGVLAESASSAGDIATAAADKLLPVVAGNTGFLAPPAALAGTSGSPVVPTTAVRSADPALPMADDPSPYAALGGPSSGAGSGASPTGPSGSAAWLNDVGLELLLPENCPVTGSPDHAPSPVSFDPGSSPD